MGLFDLILDLHFLCFSMYFDIEMKLFSNQFEQL